MRRPISLLLDLVLLALSLATGGPVAESARTIATVLAAMVAVLVIFCGVVLVIGLLEQRRPPYEV
jgi:hypothetical protein